MAAGATRLASPPGTLRWGQQGGIDQAKVLCGGGHQGWGWRNKHWLTLTGTARAQDKRSPAAAQVWASVTNEGFPSLWGGKSRAPLTSLAPSLSFPDPPRNRPSPYLRCHLCLLVLSSSTETHFLGSREQFGYMPLPWEPSPTPQKSNLMGPSKPESS